MSNLLSEFNLKLPQSVQNVREDFVYLNDNRITLKWDDNKAQQVQENSVKVKLEDDDDIEEISLGQETIQSESVQHLNTKFDNFTLNDDEFIDEESHYVPSVLSKSKLKTEAFQEDRQKTEENDSCQINLIDYEDPGQVSETEDDQLYKRDAKQIVLSIKTIKNNEEKNKDNEPSDDQVIEFKLDPNHDYETYVDRPKFG